MMTTGDMPGEDTQHSPEAMNRDLADRLSSREIVHGLEARGTVHGQDARATRVKLAVSLAICALVGSACRESADDSNRGAPADSSPHVDATSATTAKPAIDPWFVDIAADVGLDFVHTTGATGQFYFPEITGSGCGLFDYDGDGDLDVYAIQAKPLDPAAGKDRASSSSLGKNRLYRNDLDAGELRFTDVTDTAGVGDTGYGMGLAVGDYDNDGDTDLFVTNYGPNVLYRNEGNGRFVDASREALSAGDAPETLGTVVSWSTSAAFFDYDRDGFVDLFVARYVDFNVNENHLCHTRSSRRDYCGPQSFRPMPDRLYRNRGDGTFEDTTLKAGIHKAFGSGLGVISADFNRDGWPDVFVANDGNANQLWINQKDGTFENTALVAGAAYNMHGNAEAGMGVTVADVDQDGDEDVFLAHLVGEHNRLLSNDGTGHFDDRTTESSLGAVSPYTAFGLGWFDADGDTFLDLLIANGAVKIVEEAADRPYPYEFPNLMLRNVGQQTPRYEDISARAGPALRLVECSRGAAFGDIDNDGDIDVLVSNNNGPMRLLRNEIGQRRSWIALRLVGTRSNRSAIGALVRLERGGRPALLGRVHADGSYCSANDLRVYFGLGDDRGPQAVTVTWPSGLIEKFEQVPAEKHTTLREGDGTRVP